MEELVYDLFKAVAHIASSMAAGESTRMALNYKNESKYNIATDAMLGAAPDIDYVISSMEHRGWTHIPYVGFATGFLAGAVREFVVTGKPDYKNVLKNAVSGGLATLTHFIVDALSGNKISVSFGQYVELYRSSGMENSLYHLAMAIPFVAMYLYLRHKHKLQKRGV